MPVSFSKNSALIILLVITSGSGGVRAQDARRVAVTTLPSVVLILVQDANHQALAQGSGFVVGNGLIATSLHVLDGARYGSVKFSGDDKLHEITGVSGIDERRDLALLLVLAASRPPLSLANANEIGVGERVYAAGNPLGLEGTISEGIVSGVREIEGDTLFQITAPISPGSSGGPILNEAGQVLGVATAVIGGGQNLNFAIPNSYLTALIREAPRSRVRPLAELAGRPRSLKLGDRIGQDTTKGVSVAAPLRDGCAVAYSVRNALSLSVRNVRILMILKGPDGLPIHSITTFTNGPIMPGLAIRQNRVLPDGSDSCDTLELAGWTGPEPPPQRVEFRVLEFDVIRATAPSPPPPPTDRTVSQRNTQTFTFRSTSKAQPGSTIQFDTKGVEFGPWIRRFVSQLNRNFFMPLAAQTGSTCTSMISATKPEVGSLKLASSSTMCRRSLVTRT